MIIGGNRYRWRYDAPDAGAVSEIERATGSSAVFARVLASRGLGTAAEATRYLSAGDDPLADPRLLPDAEFVVARVERALERRELIAVHGHDDADGVTATTIMLEALGQLGASVVSYIPDRKTEGHGLSRAELDRLSDDGVKLIVTVDSCVSDREFIRYGNELGLATIVTDHHEIPPELPPAVAVVNPKLPTSRFPYRYMAGVGVSFRVAELLLDELGGRFGPAPEHRQWYGPRWRDESLALAAAGSIADKVPLTGENRSIVTQGLAALPRTERPGLRAVLEEGRLWGVDLDPGDVREALGPVLGRSPGDRPGTQRALDLLLTADAGEATQLARALFGRQAKWRSTAAEAWKKVCRRVESGEFDEDHPAVVLSADVPVGVVGYVASRLTEELERPVIVLTPRDSELMAEARGPSGFNFVDGFSSMRELFIGYGGHPRAAGFSMDPSNVERFKERFIEFARANPPATDPRPIDADLAPADVTPELAAELERMWPFGMANRRAVFLARGVTSADIEQAERRGVRFATPVMIGRKPVDVVFRLRGSDGVPLVSIADTGGVSTSGG